MQLSYTTNESTKPTMFSLMKTRPVYVLNELEYDRKTEFIIARDQQNTSGKLYYKISKNNETLLNTLLSDNHHLYETIQSDDEMRFHFVLENARVHPDNMDDVKKIETDMSILDMFLSQIISNFAVYYEIQLTNDDICCLNGCQIDKLLFHIVIFKKAYAKSLESIRKFATFLNNNITSSAKTNANLSILIHNKKCIMSQQIYKSTHNLRMINQSESDRKYNTKCNGNSKTLNIVNGKQNICDTFVVLFDKLNTTMLDEPKQTQIIELNAKVPSLNKENFALIETIQYEKFVENDKHIHNGIETSAQILENEKHKFLKYVSDANNKTSDIEDMFYQKWMKNETEHIKNMYYELNLNIDVLNELRENPLSLLKIKYLLDINKILKLNGTHDTTTFIAKDTILLARHYLHKNWDVIKIVFDITCNMPNVDITSDIDSSNYYNFIVTAIIVMYRKFNGNIMIASNKDSLYNGIRHLTLYRLSGRNWNDITRKSGIQQNVDEQIQTISMVYIEQLKLNPSLFDTQMKQSRNTIALQSKTITEIHLTENIIERNPAIKQNLFNAIINFPVNGDIREVKLSVISGNETKTVINTTSNYKKRNLTGKLRERVWKLWFGESLIGKCICCKTAEIKTTEFSCGHIVAEACGGKNEVSNLRPICKSCNSSMGMENMNEYIKRFGYDK